MNIVVGNKVKILTVLLIKRLSRMITKKQKINVVGKSFAHTDKKIESIFVINLDRQPDRWEKTKKELLSQIIEGGKNLYDFCHRVSAIDGKKLSKNYTSTNIIKTTYSINDQYVIDPDPRLLTIIKEKNLDINMSREEIAVALSHINIWKRIIDEKLDYSLILEDDIFFEKNFAKQLNKIWLQIPNRATDNFKFDVLYLSHKDVHWGAEKEVFSDDLDRTMRGLWWLSGYVLSFEGAKKLLDKLPVIEPVDLWINHHFRELDIFSTKSSIIFQREDITSDNKYSIMPVLSQIGIQTDKTHLELENKKGNSPVFVICPDNESMSNLNIAISLLGYRCCHDELEYFSENINKLIINEQPLLFDAYISVESIEMHYKKLDSFYKEAVFILIDQTNAIDSKDIKNKIISHFNGRNNKLLIADTEALIDWKKICNFLSCDIPNYPFPCSDNSVKNLYIKPSTEVISEVDAKITELIEHDVHPWIIPVEKIISYGVSLNYANNGVKRGDFVNIYEENFKILNKLQWTPLEDSFPSNLAVFQIQNISVSENHGLNLSLVKDNIGDKNYSAAAISSNTTYKYGKFEAYIKPSNIDGVITAFFLHRNDPWQEIDIEFLGKNTYKLLINVYFNPGDEGTVCNYGNRGTPVIIDLGFDASESFHKYAVEWEPHEIRWYVDNRLIHARSLWNPTPIPNLPMKLYCNIWTSRSEELAGKLIDDNLPVTSYFKTINIGNWNG